MSLWWFLHNAQRPKNVGQNSHSYIVQSKWQNSKIIINVDFLNNLNQTNKLFGKSFLSVKSHATKTPSIAKSCNCVLWGYCNIVSVIGKVYRRNFAIACIKVSSSWHKLASSKLLTTQTRRSCPFHMQVAVMCYAKPRRYNVQSQYILSVHILLGGPRGARFNIPWDVLTHHCEVAKLQIWKSFRFRSAETDTELSIDST